MSFCGKGVPCATILTYVRMSPERRISFPVVVTFEERFVTVISVSSAPASIVSGVTLNPLVTLTRISSVNPVVTTVTVADWLVPSRRIFSGKVALALRSGAPFSSTKRMVIASWAKADKLPKTTISPSSKLLMKKSFFIKLIFSVNFCTELRFYDCKYTLFF